MLRKLVLFVISFNLLAFLAAFNLNDSGTIENPSLAVDHSVPQSEYPPGQWDTIIEDQVFTEPLFLGPGDDNTLLINVTFRNIDDHALFIGGISNIYIKNCVIHNIDGIGIKLRSSEGMSTQNVTIDGCVIYDTEQSGIMASQDAQKGIDHPGLVIKNNLIYNNGTNDHHHNIYVQSSEACIKKNTLHSASGNGISIRSSGVVRKNKIWNSGKSCIRYYSDHQGGASDILHIASNFCYLTSSTDKESPGISLLRANGTPKKWLLDQYYIRFNTVISFTADRYGFMVQSSEFNNKHVEFYGNLVVNTQDADKIAHFQYVDYASNNYLSTSLEGFVNTHHEPYDLHLTGNSPARGFVTQETHVYPKRDIDNDLLPEDGQDAGADQF